MNNPPSPSAGATPTRGARIWLARVAALGISLGVSLALVELALAWFHPIHYREPTRAGGKNPWRSLLHQRSQLPGLAYELVPGAKGTRAGEKIEINSLGMRDDEPIPDGPDRVRLAVVGDSSTFGFGIVDGHDTYANLLEARLNARGDGHRYEVDNLGVGGYSSHDEAILLADRAPRLKPHLVILGYSLNDPEIEPIQPLHAYYQPTAFWQRFHLLRLLAQVRNEEQIREIGGGSYYHYLHREPAHWGSVVAAFQSIAATARQGQFRVLLAILPVIPEPDTKAGQDWRSRYRFTDLHRQVAEEGAKNGFEAIDLYPALSQREPKEIRVGEDDFHPNALGHQLIAQALYERIAAEYDSLLPGASSP